MARPGLAIPLRVKPADWFRRALALLLALSVVALVAPAWGKGDDAAGMPPGTSSQGGPASLEAAPVRTAVHLAASAEAVDAWPAMAVLADDKRQLSAAEAWRLREHFAPPTGPRDNLGAREGATWLHVPIVLEPTSPRAWTLRFDYALLHSVHVTIFDSAGRLLHERELGSRVPFSQRERKTRALATTVNLPAGGRYDVLVRIDTPTATLVPMAFLQPDALGLEEAREIGLQGVLSGIWLFMVVYSLVNGALHRQALFLAYALALAASWLFAQGLFGIGSMVLWPDNAWLATHVTALSPHLMVAANSYFFLRSLDMRRHAPRSAWVLITLGSLALGVALLFALDFVSYKVAAIAGMLIGTAHLALVVPTALARMRAGDPAALFVLIGCAVNLVGVAGLSVLLRGHLPVNFLSVHLVQFCFTLEMVSWLMVLGTRLEQERSAADQARREHEALHALAYTDALTGLRNRRGLELALERGMAPRASEMDRGRLSVFMIDLDGFKPVNDRWGHDTGDALLRQVARRLAQAVRPTDIVARPGGDEFVVAVCGLRQDADAAVVGRNLLAQFDEPFDLGDNRIAHIGATIGYAMQDEDGRDTAELLRRADAAMYAGKQSGKRRIVEAPASIPAARHRLRAGTIG